ncbi:MAG: nucleoside triphosphate pyrophosphohydrolase [Chloroflexota bacterium]
MGNFDKLVEIMARLRGEDGCPWDREQTRRSLTPYILEEAYELIEAIDEDNPEKIREELGDLLLQIVFQAQIGKDRGEFDMEDVARTINEKLIHRHPHVFGEAVFDTADAVMRQWEERKREEGKHKESVMEGVPRELPALLRAHRIQSRAARVGFDWKQTNEVIAKLEEELSEFRDALDAKDQAKIEEELGDVLFSIVNVSRFVKVNPEDALRKTISRFVSRFHYVEKRAAETGRNLAQMTLDQMDDLWKEAKAAGEEGSGSG